MKLSTSPMHALPIVQSNVRKHWVSWGIVFIASHCLVARADDDAVPVPATGSRDASHVAVVASPSDASADAARFTTDSQWEIAGYNSEEIIYTITIFSQDPRILRCRTQLQGYYRENGKQVSIADQQTSTVFPDQQVRVGNWTGLDQSAGANFTVKCRAM